MKAAQGHRAGLTSLDLNTGFELAGRGWGDDTIQQDVVFLLDLVTGVCYAVDQLAIGRQQHEAGTVQIQPASGNEAVHPKCARHAFNDGWPSAIIAHGRKMAVRFVRKQVHVARASGSYLASIYIYAVTMADIHNETLSKISVDSDVTAENQRRAVPP
jgi:hypothetical protein